MKLSELTQKSKTTELKRACFYALNLKGIKIPYDCSRYWNIDRLFYQAFGFKHRFNLHQRPKDFWWNCYLHILPYLTENENKTLKFHRRR